MENSNQLVNNKSDYAATTVKGSDLNFGVLAKKIYRKPELQIQQTTDLRLHPILQQFNEPMSKEERDSLGADIKVRGVIVPIQVNQFGEILDGVHRYEEAMAGGLKEVPTQIFYFMSDEEQELHIYKANMMRKKLSTQHKYITIARISALYEKGRGGDHTKSKKASDTSLQDQIQGDVLEETSRHLGISPEQVKTARRYYKEILKFPKYHKIEPTRFLNSIVPLHALKNEYFRDSLIALALEKNADLKSAAIGDLNLYDRLLCACEKQNKSELAANYLVACLKNESGLDPVVLARKLGTSIEDVSNKGESDKRQTISNNESACGDLKNKELEDNVEADAKKGKENVPTSSDQKDNFEKSIGILESKRNAIKKQIYSIHEQFGCIAEFSNNHAVSIKRMVAANDNLESILNWIEGLPSELDQLVPHFLTTGYRGGNDDPLNLFPPSEVPSRAADDVEGESL